MKKITLTSRMVFGTLNGGKAGTLERLFTLHASLCDRFMQLNIQQASEGYSVCVCVSGLVFDFISAIKKSSVKMKN